MCIIALKPAEKPMFDNAEIRRMFEQNPDGAGVSFPTGTGKVHLKKGFMFEDDLLEYLRDKHDILVDRPVMLHCRIGTGGGNTPINCHPYPVFEPNSRLEGDYDLVVSHNGILADFIPPHKSKLNDTQVFINKVLSRLPKDFLQNEGIYKLIETAIRSSKLAFMDGEGNFTTMGSWITDDGYMYSNTSYKPYYPYLFDPSKYDTAASDEDEDTDGLSFASKFITEDVDENGEVVSAYYPNSSAELTKAVEEMDQNPNLNEDGRYGFSSANYYYALEPGCIRRYNW